MNIRIVRYDTKTVIVVCLLVLLALVSLTGCSSASGKGAADDPATMLAKTGTIIGNTLDNSATIVVSQLTATVDKQNANNTIIIGTYELTNISSASLPAGSVNFGVLDKTTDARYWGSTSVSGVGDVAPKQTVRGMFFIPVPRTVNLKQCNLIFGPIPDINFQKPLIQK